MSKPIYLSEENLREMKSERDRIFESRNRMYVKYGVDLLDTDTLSALSLHDIIVVYDSNYNINLARNGEDAKSGDSRIEQKAARVKGKYTKKGKLRKNADRDAVFMFHAMGDIEHSRYVFAARSTADLSVSRIYDVSSKENCQKIIDSLLEQRKIWQAKVALDPKKGKHDLIYIYESFILNNIVLPFKSNINGCVVFKDFEDKVVSDVQTISENQLEFKFNSV